MYAIADIVLISSSKIIFRHCYKLFLTSISCYEEKKASENAVDAAIEELIEMNILMYYRFVDMLYFVDAICSYVYIHIKLHFLESRSVSSRFRLPFSLLQFLRRFFSSALFYLNFLP